MSFIIAMEDAENTTPEADAVAAAQTETEVVAANAEVVESADEIESDVADAAQGLQDADELADIQQQADAAIERGDGLSEDAAAMATIAIERISHRLYGAGVKQRIVPATESFGHSSTRLASTIMVSESISETLKNFWVAIKTFAMRLWEKITQFVAKVVGSKKLAGKNIENLIERAKKLDSNFVVKEKMLKNESLAKSLSVNGKMNMSTVQEIANNTTRLAMVANDIEADTARMVGVMAAGSVAADIPKLVESLSNYVRNVSNLPKKASITVAQGLSVVSSKGKPTGGTVNSEVAYGPFTNSVVLNVSTSTLMVGGVEAGSVSFGFKQAKAKQIAKEAEALDQAGILEVLKAAQTINDELESYSKISKEYGKITDGISKLADTILSSLKSAASKGNNPGVERQAKETHRFVNDCLSIANTFSTQGLAQYNSLVHAMTNYASASLANMGPKSK